MGIELGTSLTKRPHTDQMCQPLPPFLHSSPFLFMFPSRSCAPNPPPPTPTNSFPLKCLPYKLDYPWKTSAHTAAKTAELPCHCVCVMSILQ